MITTTKTISHSYTTLNGLVTRQEFNGLAADEFTWAEISRILSLPITRPMDAGELEAFNAAHIQAHAYDKGFRLFKLQAEALASYLEYGCLFGKIPVGEGKTLLSLMVAQAAYAKGLTRMVLLVPPEIMSQLVDTDIPWARSRVALNYPIHILGGKSIEYRRSMCASKRKGLYIIPYSLLSTKDTEENLTALAPQIIIADEVHRLANASAARSRRMTRILEKFSPEFVVMSGTITSKTIRDYYHIIKFCLRDRCPLPQSTIMANDWAALIDSEASSPDAEMPPSGTAPLLPLVSWAKKYFPEERGGFPHDVYGFRRAYKRRLNSTPGVVSSDDTSLGTSLVMHNIPVPGYESHPQWPALKKLCDQVTEMWLTPNGDEIDHAIHTWKWLNELSAGFYNELIWPVPADLAKRRGIDEAAAAEVLDRARLHHQAVQLYSRELRAFLLERSRPGIDTPLLVGQDMLIHGAKHVGDSMYDLWMQARNLRFEGMPERDSHAVRVCNFKVIEAVKWATELRKQTKDGGIIWVLNQEMGEWVMDSLAAAGVPGILHCPSGEAPNKQIVNHANADKIIVASIWAHREGKNLQHFQHQYFVQWPRNCKVAEQVLGRLHRSGQKADELIVNTNATLYFDQLNFAACLNDALYVHQSTGSRQKLIYASYDPQPRIFPPAVLSQQGLEATKLDSTQAEMMVEKFGGYGK